MGLVHLRELSQLPTQGSVPTAHRLDQGQRDHEVVDHVLDESRIRVVLTLRGRRCRTRVVGAEVAAGEQDHPGQGAAQRRTPGRAQDRDGGGGHGADPISAPLSWFPLDRDRRSGDRRGIFQLHKEVGHS